MKTVTLTAPEELIEAARARARSESTTLNDQFRLWLASYADLDRPRRYDEVMSGLRGRVVGRRLSRDERSER